MAIETKINYGAVDSETENLRSKLREEKASLADGNKNVEGKLLGVDSLSNATAIEKVHSNTEKGISTAKVFHKLAFFASTSSQFVERTEREVTNQMRLQ